MISSSAPPGAAPTLRASSPSPVSNHRTTTLVVDRDSHRGLNLAISVLAAKTVTTSAVTTAAHKSHPHPLLLTRDRTFAEEVVSQVLALVLCPDDGEAERLRYPEIDHAGTVARPAGDLILDNPPSGCNQSKELVELQQRFKRVVIISAYPVFRPGIDEIVASTARNKFMWPTLYDAYLKNESGVAAERFNKMTQELDQEQALCLRLQASTDDDAARTWSASTMAHDHHVAIPAAV